MEISLFIAISLMLLCFSVSVLALAGAEVIGRIGTVIDKNTDYVPTNDSSRFFLNARDPASTSGTVSKVCFCYILNTDQVAARLYRATVGFYQYRDSDDTYVLSSSFNITKNYTGGDRKFQCEDMMIPKVEVRKGEMIGVCSRDFDKSTGRIIMFSEGEEETDSLFRDGVDDRNSFCYIEATVPKSFTMDQIVNVPNRRLLLTANITDQGSSIGFIFHPLRMEIGWC